LIGISNAAPTGRATTWAYGASQSQAYLGWFIGNFQETIFGFAHVTNSSTFVANKRIISCEDALTNQVELLTDATGHVFFRRNGTNIGGTSTNSLASLPLGWAYFQFKTKIAGGTGGSCEFLVNGVSWLLVTGVNT